MVVNLSDFAGSTGNNPGATLGVFFEQPHFAEKIARIEVGENDFVTIFILDDYAHRTVDDIVQRLRFIAGVNNSTARCILLAVAMMQEIIQSLILTRRYFCDRVN